MKLIVRVSKRDLAKGVRGDSCPILMAMKRALAQELVVDQKTALSLAKLSRKQWRYIRPFRFELVMRRPPTKPEIRK